MDRQDSWKRTEDMEIDLKDLLYRLCMQWKQIAVTVFVSVILFTGCSYLRRNTEIRTVESEVYELELTEEEEWDVESAVKLNDEIKELEKYLRNSIIMQIDPYNKNKVVMLYSIGSMKGQELQKITESYLNFIVNGGAAEKLKKADSASWKMDIKYLSELVTAYQKTYSLPYQAVVQDTADDIPAEAVFYVEITGKNEQQAWNLAMDMQSVLKSHSVEIKKMAGSHKLTLLSIEKGVQTDGVLQTQQNEKRNLLTASRQNLKGMTDAFHNVQMEKFQDISGIESSLEKTENGHAGFSIKSILIVIAGSIFIYCCVYGCIYLFRDTIKSPGEIKRLYLFPFFGSMHLKKKTGRAGSRHFAAYQKKQEQEMMQMLGRVKLSCKKQGITKICMASDYSFSSQEKDCIAEMTDKLRQCGIDMITVDNVNRNAALWDSVVEAGSVLVACRIGVTTHRAIDEEMSFYQENGMEVLGAAAWIL